MKTLIRNAHVVTPGMDYPGAAVLLEGETIIGIVPAGENEPAADSVFDAGWAYAVPGFIDIHTHGAVGYDITDDQPEAVAKIAEAKLREGCTRFCPTTLTLSEAQLAVSLRNVAAYDNRFSQVAGVHLEGPYINPACLGAQNPAFVRKPDAEEVKRLNAISPVSQVSYAVEMEGGAEFARKLGGLGIVAACGHSKATFAEFEAGHRNGLRHLTHFCNQMTPLHHRDIGLVGAGFLLDDVAVEIICDKIHLCPEMIRLVFAKKPIESILLITDSMRASHLPDGPSSIGGLDVVVKNGEARLASTGALAGSMLKMNEALRNVCEVTGLPVKDVIQTTSLNQAKERGEDHLYGRIAPGYKAEIALLDRTDFSVKAVFLRGSFREFK